MIRRRGEEHGTDMEEGNPSHVRDLVLHSSRAQDGDLKLEAGRSLGAKLGLTRGNLHQSGKGNGSRCTDSGDESESNIDGEKC